MKVSYAPDFSETVVFQEMLKDHVFRSVCQMRLEPVYSLPEEERSMHFSHTYQLIFKERGLGLPIEEVLREFPLSGVEEVLVLKALSVWQEGVELSRDRKRLGIRLLCKSLDNRPGFKGWLRHELRRIEDMLDKDFGYISQRVSENPLEENALRDRYAAIWNTYIAGRLKKRWTEEVNSDSEQLQFEKAFFFLPFKRRRSAFHEILHSTNLNHKRILEIARDPGTLGETGEENGEETLPRLLPGSLCPLCGFPTYAWAKIGDAGNIIDTIEADFPGWDSSEGVCQRCLERYSIVSAQVRGGAI